MHQLHIFVFRKVIVLSSLVSDNWGSCVKADVLRRFYLCSVQVFDLHNRDSLYHQDSISFKISCSIDKSFGPNSWKKLRYCNWCSLGEAVVFKCWLFLSPIQKKKKTWLLLPFFYFFYTTELEYCIIRLITSSVWFSTEHSDIYGIWNCWKRIKTNIYWACFCYKWWSLLLRAGWWLL